MPLTGFSATGHSLDLQGAFSLLARNSAHPQPLDEALRTLTEAVSRMLIVERVSLWGLSDTRDAIHCLDLFELTTNRHSAGSTLRAVDYPAYFTALEHEELIVANDAETHAHTREFRDRYLIPNNIVAILDAPIHVNGDLQGVLCIEQVGLHHGWTAVQRMFAAAAANLGALVLIQHESNKVHAALHEANARLSAMFRAMRAAIVIANASDGSIVDLNPAAERLFGRSREELIGQPQTVLHPAGETQHYHALFAGHVRNPDTPIRCQILAAGGNIREVDINAQVVDIGAGGTLIQGVFRPVEFVSG